MLNKREDLQPVTCGIVFFGMVIMLVAGIVYGVRVKYVDNFNSNGYTARVIQMQCTDHYNDQTCVYIFSIQISGKEYACGLQQINQPVLNQTLTYKVDLDKRTNTCVLRFCSEQSCDTSSPLNAIWAGLAIFSFGCFCAVFIPCCFKLRDVNQAPDSRALPGSSALPDSQEGSQPDQSIDIEEPVEGA